MKFFEFKKRIKGFTLVEALIAITILMISVAAPMKLANDGVVYATISEQQIIAYYLAQDSMEYIINRKTGNRLELKDLLFGLDNCRTDLGSGYGCTVDSVSGMSDTPEFCNNAICSNSGVLYYYSNSNYYSHKNGVNASKTAYKRYVKITPKRKDSGGTRWIEAAIEVIVQWNDSFGTSRQYVLKNNILSW